MGIAALVLGIISLIIGFIPLCGSIALLPAIIGIILGIVDIVLKKKKGEKIAIGVTGTILSAIATIIIIFWVFVFSAAVSSLDANEIVKSLDNYTTTYYNY